MAGRVWDMVGSSATALMPAGPLAKNDKTHGLRRSKPMQWNKYYELLCRYKEANGDVLVPQTYIAEGRFLLGKWVNNQRIEYKKLQAEKPSQLTKEMIDQLDKIDFQWDIRALKWKYAL